MKVLVVYHCGLSEEAKAFYREYVNQGIDLDVIVPSKSAVAKVESASGYLSYSKKDDEKGYNFIPVDLRNPLSYGEGFKFLQLFKAIKRSKPDVIHAFDEYTSFYLGQVIICRNILYGRKVPVLAFASQNLAFGPNELPPLVFTSFKKFFKRVLRRIQYRLMFVIQRRYLDGVIGCTPRATERVKELGVNMPMRPIFLGMDFSRFYPKDRNLCRKNLGIPQNVKLVGYIGKLIEEKGVDKLIMAISQLDNYYLMLVGDGEYAGELDKLIDSSGIKNRIYRYNSVGHDKLADYYNCLDVLVLPSQSRPMWQEQYGRVLVEAMGCGISIVGSSSGEISTVLKDYPKHLIFKEDSADDLVDKIKKIDELKFPNDFNLDKFLYKFSVENFVKENIRFFKELIVERNK